MMEQSKVFPSKLYGGLAMVALAVLLAIFLSRGPALADHTVIQEEIDTYTGCEVLDPVLDVSLGFPVILIAMGCGDNVPPTILMYARRKDSASGNGGDVNDFAGGPIRDWSVKELMIGAGYLLNGIYGINIGYCVDWGPLNKTGLDDCVTANIIYQTDGRTYAASYQQFFTDEGLFTGGSTMRNRRITWPDGSIPSLMGSGPYGIPLLGWTPTGLYALNDIASSPTMLASRDEVGWPFNGDPPTALGTYGESDSHFAVTLGGEDIYAFLNQDPATWNQVKDPLPSELTLDEATDIQAGDTDTPTATVSIDDGVLEWEYLKETTVSPDPELCEDGEDGWKRFYAFWKSAEGESYRYYIYQCGDTGRMYFKISNVTEQFVRKFALLNVEGYFGDQKLHEARVDPQGNLVLVTSVDGVGTDGGPAKKLHNTKVVIDYDKIDWHEA